MTAVHGTLSQACEDASFMPDGRLLGVPCFHLYERDAQLPVS
jgi:hypothetical protein